MVIYKKNSEKKYFFALLKTVVLSEHGSIDNIADMLTVCSLYLGNSSPHLSPVSISGIEGRCPSHRHKSTPVISIPASVYDFF